MIGDKTSKVISFKKNFTWSFFGNIIYVICQWLILSVVAKLGDPSMVGQYALGLAVTAPIVMLTNLQLRTVQATDVSDKYKFGEYLGLRIVTSIIYITVVIVVSTVYSMETAIIIILVGISKVIESISDVIFGLFQKNERMDLISVSKVFKGLASVIMFSLTMYISNSLIMSLLALILSWILVLVVYDIKNAKHITRTIPILDKGVMYKVFILTFPLGVYHMLGSLNTNIPRYLLEMTEGEAVLGYFAALAYVVIAGDTILIALGQTATPSLSKYFISKNRTKFYSLLTKISAFGFLLGCIGLTGAYLFGEEIITILYSSEYSSHTDVFLLIVIAAVIKFTGTSLNYAITSAQYFKIQPYVGIILILVSVSVGYNFINEFGIIGAGYTLIVTAAVQLIISLLILAHIYRKEFEVT
jgi:O-antigen/teichoic acid export membrane protein